MPTSSHPSIAKLQREVREWFPSLSRAQANVLGEMAYAMLMTDGCGMTRMSSYMAELLGQPMNTLRQKYREIYYEKEAKAGVKNQQKKRREIVPEELFADLLRGVLKGWEGEKTLVLALDASALGDRFTVLSISVMYRGCGMRVAWTMQEGHQAGEWRPHWERMLRQLADVVPAEWIVLVMADRGLYAAWLYQAIQANGWHPFLRVKKDLSFRAQGEEAFGTIGGRVKRTGREWKGTGEWSEKGDRMGGTVLVRWEQGYEEAICVVSDLPAEKARTAWYQMRFWIEDEYKDGKRGWFRLRTDQDDQPATGEQTVVGVRSRPAKSDCAGRAVRSRGAESQTEEQEAPVWSQTMPRTASLAPGASAGTGTERVIARDHGPAGSRVGRQEALAQRSGESRATALPLACGETGVQKSPDEEKTPRGEEAEQTTRPGQGQTGAASAGAGGQTSCHPGAQARKTRAAGGQTSRHPGVQAGETRAAGG